MFIPVPRMIQEVRDSIEFVIKNLNQQYVLPHYAEGKYEGMYNYDDKINSKLFVFITVENLTELHDSDRTAIDHIGALDILARTSVEDDLMNDE